MITLLAAVETVEPVEKQKQWKPKQVKNGGNLNITCVAVGSPMPFVKWRQGVKDLTPDDAVPIGGF